MAKKKNARRKDGRYEYKIPLGISQDTGKRKFKTLYAHSEAELELKIEAAKLEMRMGIDITASNDTFSKWAERWYSIKSGSVSDSQRINLTCYLSHAKTHIGNYPISKIKPFHIDKMLSDLAVKNPNTDRPMGKKTLRDIRNVCVNVFDMAIENDVLAKNPAAKRKVPESAPQEVRRALTPEEQKWIVNTEHRARIGALVMMLAGLRKGELIPLLWSDVDLDNLFIRVNKSVEAVKGKLVVKAGTKSKKEKARVKTRDVNITLDLAQELQEAKAESSSIYVCPNAHGGIHTMTTWRVMWNSYKHALNFENGNIIDKPKSRFAPVTIPQVINNITPHMLRHTYATLLYSAGSDVLTASKLLGHSDVKTTLAIYTHLEEQMAYKSVDKLDDYVRQLFVNESKKDSNANA